MVVSTDVLTGISVGVALALIRLLYNFSTLDIVVEENQMTGKIDVFLRGAATFIKLPVLAETLENLNKDANVQIHLQELTYIDHACLDLLESWRKQHNSSGGDLTMDWSSLQKLYKNKAGSNALYRSKFVAAR